MKENILTLAQFATELSSFNSLDAYADYCWKYLSYIHESLQAVIVARNETNYRFFQYDSSAEYAITRPINSDLMYGVNDFDDKYRLFRDSLKHIREIQNDRVARQNINRFVYTLQQSIGAALDALPSESSNRARKINGQLFEKLIRILLLEIGVDVKEGTVKVPVIVNGQKLFSMSYQHDVIVGNPDYPLAIGSVKTSSKDRIDKVFIDKFLYNRLTSRDVPHFAVFLNDVQRAGQEPNYQVNTTFLTGHFKGYTVKLNALDGVYYCDLRPVMRTDELLRDNISELDTLLVSDIWRFTQ